MQKLKISLLVLAIIPLSITCDNEVGSESVLIETTCGSLDSLVVYKIIFLTDTEPLFFHVATSDTSLIRKADEELSKPLENRIKHINGLLAPGPCEYNPEYDWHFLPNEWDLVEASIEWCDVFPANPDSTGLKRACPWSTRIYERL